MVYARLVLTGCLIAVMLCNGLHLNKRKNTSTENVEVYSKVVHLLVDVKKSATEQGLKDEILKEICNKECMQRHKIRRKLKEMLMVEETLYI